MRKSNTNREIVAKPEAILAVAEQEEMRTERANFTESVKAQIFARDRATCGLSGINLWLLEEGACGFYALTHIDHIQAATRGGEASADNGIATHWLYNSIKRDSVRAIYLFDSGAPTIDFFTLHRQLSPEMAQRLANYAEMHHSDWYFNAALSNVLKGVCWLHDWKDLNYTRDADYYAKATLNKIKEWKEIKDADSIASMEERGLVLDPPLADQKLFLSLRDMSSVKKIRELMEDILPYHVANTGMVHAFNKEYGKYLDGETVDFGSVWDYMDNPHVSDDTFGRMMINMRLIADPHADLSKPPEPISDEEFDKLIEEEMDE